MLTSPELEVVDYKIRRRDGFGSAVPTPQFSVDAQEFVPTALADTEGYAAAVQASAALDILNIGDAPVAPSAPTTLPDDVDLLADDDADGVNDLEFQFDEDHDLAEINTTKPGSKGGKALAYHSDE